MTLGWRPNGKPSVRGARHAKPNGNSLERSVSAHLERACETAGSLAAQRSLPALRQRTKLRVANQLVVLADPGDAPVAQVDQAVAVPDRGQAVGNRNQRP